MAGLWNALFGTWRRFFITVAVLFVLIACVDPQRANELVGIALTILIVLAGIRLIFGPRRKG